MIKSIHLVLMLLVVSACKRETRLDIFRRINTEVLRNSEAFATLRTATSTIGHRLTGSDNGHKAEEYVYNKFREYGFDDVTYQEFEVNSWSRGSVEVMIGEDMVASVSLAHSPVASDIEGELIDMGNGLERDYQRSPTAIEDKIALVYIGILEGGERGLSNLHRTEKTAIAIRYGAKGIIFFNEADGGVLLTGTASVTGKLIPIPAVCIGKENGMALKEKLKEKKMRARIKMTNISGPIKARNVIATLKGSSIPDEKIVIGGHLDSWDLATGAIDNGIGSFAVLDIARAFKASQLAPKRTIQFVMFMGEEQGMLGSRHMVREAIKDGSINSVKYMMNLDMSGNPVGINAGGKLSDTAFFTTLGDEIRKIDTVFSNKFEKRLGLHSDHQPFMLEGVPILEVVSNLDPSIYDCYHADCDNFKLVNEQHLKNTARFGAMILYAVADSDELPAEKMDSETTKRLMIDNNLKEPLIIWNDWRWEK